VLLTRVVTCPACWQPVELQLDLSGEDQDYVEDCSVCCRPMRVSYSAQQGELTDFQVESAA
jgi:hypothetical protein